MYRRTKPKGRLDENIEPERFEKFLNINSSENFKPGHNRKTKNAKNQDDGWNFWNTLKNPLQWFGITDSSHEAEQNEPENISHNTDSSRNRSVTHNSHQVPNSHNPYCKLR